MGFFSEEGDYIDYTLLKKKGLLKVPEIKSLDLKNDDGYVDISSAMKEASQESLSSQPYPSYDNSSSTSASSSSAMPDFGFLGSLAGVGSSESSQSPATSILSDAPANLDLATLRVKIDDFEYKLDRLIERLEKIESKLPS